MNELHFTSEKDYRDTILIKRQRAYEQLAKLDGFLRQSDITGAKEFVKVFQDEQFRKDYIPCLEQIAYAYILAAITKDELEAGISNLFIGHGESVDELRVLIKKVEFLLWELEFCIDPEAERNLYDFLEQNRISAEALNGIIIVAGMDKKRCFMLISCLYLERHRIEAAFKMLMYARGLFQEDKEILTMLIQLCRNLGMESLAEEYEEKMKCIKQ